MAKVLSEGKGGVPPPSEASGAAAKKEEVFDWVQLRKELDTDQNTGRAQKDRVGALEKFKHKFSENPIVPIGKEERSKVQASSKNRLLCSMSYSVRTTLTRIVNLTSI